MVLSGSCDDPFVLVCAKKKREEGVIEIVINKIKFIILHAALEKCAELRGKKKSVSQG